MSLADQILSFEDRQPQRVTEWGVEFFVKPMSGADRDAYDLENSRARKLAETEGRDPNEAAKNFRSRYLVRCLFDDQGNRIFTDDQAEQLAAKNAATIQRLFELASGVNRTEPDAVRNAAKN